MKAISIEMLTWTALLGLTCLTYVAYTQGVDSPVILFLLAAAKFSAIFLVFMHMKQSHVIWKVLATTYISLIFLSYIIIN